MLGIFSKIHFEHFLKDIMKLKNSFRGVHLIDQPLANYPHIPSAFTMLAKYMSMITHNEKYISLVNKKLG